MRTRGKREPCVPMEKVRGRKERKWRKGRIKKVKGASNAEERLKRGRSKIKD
jgi:hypothetical protein